MVQLNFLSGKQAGTAKVARLFPVRIGRSTQADIQIAEDGVWDQHCEIQFERGAGFVLAVSPTALVRVNSEPVQKAVLKNGDQIEIGVVRSQFWLSAARQSDFRVREWATWIGLGLICLGQVALVYFLLR